MAITPSPLAKAKLQAIFAARRADELFYMVGRDGIEVAEQLSGRLSLHLGRMEDLVLVELQRAWDAEQPDARGPTPGAMIPRERDYTHLRGKKAEDMKELRQMLKDSRVKHETKLREIESRIPVEVKPGIQRAIDRSRQAYQEAIRITGEDD